MEARGLKRQPAFNTRPMVLTAVGLLCGIVIARYIGGAHAVFAVCLLLILCAASIPLKEPAITVFLAAVAIGFARMLPYTLSQAGSLNSSSVFTLANADVTLPDFIIRLSQSLYARCDSIFREASPLMRAMLLGDRSELDYFSRTVFRAAGVAHVLALSGLHVGVLAGILAYVIPKRHPGLRFAGVAAFLTLYCAIAAFPSSLIRASIMTLCMLAAPLFNRKNDPLSSLALAFCLITLSSPLRMFSAGFHLSFSAAAGVIMLYQPVSQYLSKLPNSIAAALAVTISATLGTLPFTLMIFARLPLYSVFSNLIIVPMVTIALPIALAALLLSFVWYPLGMVLAFPARSFSGASEYVSEMFASLPHSMLRFENPSIFACVLFCAALVFLSKFCLLAQKPRLVVSSSLIAVSAFALILL